MPSTGDAGGAALNKRGTVRRMRDFALHGDRHPLPYPPAG